MNEMNRRTFFFLGLGIMGGKILYPPTSIINPTLKQIQFVTSTRDMRIPLQIRPGGVWNQPYLEYFRLLANGEIWDPICPNTKIDLT